MDYDVFISYAHEDKDTVEKLVPLLTKDGLRVWLDTLEITLGDDIAEEINKGLLKSRYGVVILSKTFLEKKKWTKKELSSLLNRQATSGKKVILPVLHGLTPEELGTYSSLLAGIHAARTSDGLEFVAKQIVEVCSEPEPEEVISVFKDSSGHVGPKEQCMDVIRRNDIIAWRKLIIDLTESIPEQLKKWKRDIGETAASQGGKDWEDALVEAANICMPGFVPIFAATESGKTDFWKEAMGFTKRLFILGGEMGGGATWAIHIGYHMLYVVNFLGLSIAAELKLLDLVNEWFMLKMPDYSAGDEIHWVWIPSAHCLPEGLNFDRDNPFKFILSISQSDLCSGFYPNQKRMINNMLMANLLASMMEFRLCCQDSNCLKRLTDNTKQTFNIPPLWCQTNPEEFRALTLNLFGDSECVIKFVFPKRSAVSARFWQHWNNWHRLCIGYWNFRWREAIFLRLPGQPDLRKNFD